MSSDLIPPLGDTVNDPVNVKDLADAAPNAAAPSQGQMVGGWDGTNLRILNTNSDGILNISARGYSIGAGQANWTSATPVPTDSLQNNTGVSTLLVSLKRTGTITDGTIQFIGEDANGDRTICHAVDLATGNATTAVTLENLSTTVVSTFHVSVSGFANVGARLSEVIVGSGSVLVTYFGVNAESSFKHSLLMGKRAAGMAEFQHVESAVSDPAPTQEGLVTRPIPGTSATSLGKAEDNAHASGDVGVEMLGVRNDANATRTSADGDYSPISTDSAGNQKMVGDIANDSADAGNPIKIGGQARTTNPTAVGNADRVNAIYDDIGRQIVVPYHCRDRVVTANITLSSTTETTLVAAGGAGVFRDMITVMVANNSSSNVTVDFRDSTGTGVELSIRCPANNTVSYFLGVPHPQDVANNPWTAQLSAAVTDVDIHAMFVENN